MGATVLALGTNAMQSPLDDEPLGPLKTAGGFGLPLTRECNVCRNLGEWEGFGEELQEMHLQSENFEQIVSQTNNPQPYRLCRYANLLTCKSKRLTFDYKKSGQNCDACYKLSQSWETKERFPLNWISKMKEMAHEHKCKLGKFLKYLDKAQEGPTYKKGEKVEAQYKDGKWYPAYYHGDVSCPFSEEKDKCVWIEWFDQKGILSTVHPSTLKKSDVREPKKSSLRTISEGKILDKNHQEILVGSVVYAPAPYNMCRFVGSFTNGQYKQTAILERFDKRTNCNRPVLCSELELVQAPTKQTE